MSSLKLFSVLAVAALVVLAGGFTIFAQSQHEHGAQAEPATQSETDEDTIQQMNQCLVRMQEMMQTLDSGEQITLEQMRDMMRTMISHQMMMHRMMQIDGPMGMHEMMSRRGEQCPMREPVRGVENTSRTPCMHQCTDDDSQEEPSESGHASHAH